MIKEIDYSQANCFLTCPRKYHNKYNLNLKKSDYDDTSVDKEFGSAAHCALEAFYKKKGNPIDAFKAEFGDLKGEKLKTLDNGCFLIQSYLDRYTAQDRGWEILDVEVNDCIMIGNLKYIVKIDLIIKDRGNIYVVEHKTSSASGMWKQKFFKQFMLNTQVSGYTYYTTKRFGQCSGVIINPLFMNTVKKPILVDPSQVTANGYYKDVETKYSKYYGKDMSYLSGFNCSFERNMENRYPEQLVDFETNVTTIAKRVNQCYEDNLWARNESSCTDFRGCEYIELCLSCGDEQIIETNYEVVDNKKYLKE